MAYRKQVSEIKKNFLATIHWRKVKEAICENLLNVGMEPDDFNLDFIVAYRTTGATFHSRRSTMKNKHGNFSPFLPNANYTVFEFRRKTANKKKYNGEYFLFVWADSTSSRFLLSMNYEIIANVSGEITESAEFEVLASQVIKSNGFSFGKKKSFPSYVIKPIGDGSFDYYQDRKDAYGFRNVHFARKELAKKQLNKKGNIYESKSVTDLFGKNVVKKFPKKTEK